VHGREIRARAVKLYASGLSVRSVADRLRRENGIAVTPQTVSRWARELGLSRPVGGPRTVEVGEEARRLYESGLGLKDVAGRLGACATTVSERLREMGVAIRPRGSRYLHVLTEDRLRSLYVGEGRSVGSIAEEVGCSQGTVYRLLRVYGLRGRLKKRR